MHTFTTVRHCVLCFVSGLLITFWSNGLTTADVIVNGQINGTSDVFYPVAANDLINQGQPSFLNAVTTDFSPFSGASTDNLNNGTIGVSRSNQEIAYDLDGTWTTTFFLNLSVAPLGYDITQINTFAGWSTVDYEQHYEVLFSSLGDASFWSLGTFAYFPPIEGALNSTLIEITDSSGVLANGVDAIRFNFLPTPTGGGAMREIDVFGYTTVPEPSSAALILFSCMGLWQRRKRSR